MNYLSITKRWFINVASIVIVILLSVSVLLLLSMRNYYYGVASMALDAYSSDKIASSFSRYEASSSGFEKAGRDFVENFPDKDIMAVWIIDKNGDIILSSSGFDIKEKVDMPDYVNALNSEHGSARFTGKLPSGEKIMASTCIYNFSTGVHGGAVRFMISLEAIDSQLIRICFIVAFCCVFMFSLLILSGSVFIRSIVNPVKDIGDTAKKNCRR